MAIIGTTTLVSAQSSARRTTPSSQTKQTTQTRPSVRQAPLTPAKSVSTAPAKPAPEQSASVQPAVSQTKTEPVTTSASQAAVRRQSSAQPARSVSNRSVGARAKYLNLGIGLATYYGGGVPIGLSYEASLKSNKNFSVGASLDYFRYNYGYYSSHYNFIYAGARASYHLGEALNTQNDKFDPYIGATLGFRYAGYSDSYGYDYSYGSSYNSGLYLGVHLGSRFMFSDKIGAFAEVGYGVSALKLGLTAKF
ncbi:hypothetical protein GCM10028807_16480 [Spirosoma daeguense]